MTFNRTNRLSKCVSDIELSSDLLVKFLMYLGQKGYDHSIFTKSRVEKLGMLFAGRQESTY